MSVESEASPQISVERDGERPVLVVQGTAPLTQVFSGMLSDSQTIAAPNLLSLEPLIPDKTSTPPPAEESAQDYQK